MAERDIMKQIRDDTAKLKRGFHPKLLEVLGPMLSMADDHLESTMLDIVPSSTKKSGTAKKGLPQVDRDTGIKALKEVCVRVCFVFVYLSVYDAINPTSTQQSCCMRVIAERRTSLCSSAAALASW